MTSLKCSLKLKKKILKTKLQKHSHNATHVTTHLSDQTHIIHSREKRPSQITELKESPPTGLVQSLVMLMFQDPLQLLPLPRLLHLPKLTATHVTPLTLVQTLTGTSQEMLKLSHSDQPTHQLPQPLKVIKLKKNLLLLLLKLTATHAQLVLLARTHITHTLDQLQVPQLLKKNLQLLLPKLTATHAMFQTLDQTPTTKLLEMEQPSHLALLFHSHPLQRRVLRMQPQFRSPKIHMMPHNWTHTLRLHLMPLKTLSQRAQLFTPELWRSDLHQFRKAYLSLLNQR